MPRDIEDLLRASLTTRAHDIEPDPELFGRVQRRIRRQRRFRFGAAGVAAAAVLAGAALAAPTLIDRRVEFEPAPVTSQPPAERDGAAAAPVPDGLIFTDGSSVYQHAIREDAEVIVVEGEDDPESPVIALSVHPDSSWSNALVAYARAEGCGELAWAAVGSNDQGLARDGGVLPVPAGMCPTAPIFSPDGNALTWAAASERDGTWQLHVASWPDTNEVRSVDLPWGPQTLAVVAQGWVSTPQPTGKAFDGYIVVTVDTGDHVEAYELPLNADGGGLPGVQTDAATPLGGEDGWSPIAFADAGMTTADDEPVTYTLDVTFAEGRAIGAVRVSRYEGSELAGSHEPRQQVLPARPPGSITDHWLSAVGDTALYGGGAGAWLTTWDADGFTAENAMPEDVVHAGLFVASAHEPPQPAQAQTDGQTTVQVFFAHGACGEDVRPYPRTVEGPGVLRGALERLLSGPNDEEIAAGAQSVFSDDTAEALRTVTIADNGVARIDFADFSGHIPSTSCAMGALFAELEATVRQFTTVEEAVYSFDGSIDDFYTYYQLGVPTHRPDIPLAVTRMQERIADAVVSAGDGDYAPLSELIDREQFSCSFSDQNEDCVALWRQQEADGQDPLGPLAEILREQPIANPDAAIWVWPSEWLTDDDYLGPRTGIAEDGTWRYYQQGGD